MKLRYNMQQRRWIRYHRFCLSIGIRSHSQCCGVSLETCMPGIRFWNSTKHSHEPRL